MRVEQVGNKVSLESENNKGACWSIQFLHEDFITACSKCEYFLTKQCGGSDVLVSKILNKFGNSASLMTKHEITKYFQDDSLESEFKNNFYNFYQEFKNTYLLRNYVKAVKKQKSIKKTKKQSNKTKKNQ